MRPMKLTLRSCLASLACAATLFLSPNPARAAQMADFVFIIDATSSMGGEISAVKNGLGAFVTSLNSAQIDYRFSIVLYGGAPELVLDWTTSASATETAFDSISVSGAVSGFQNNHNVNPEAGLEAIRIVLGAAPNSTLVRNNVGGSGGLSFRANARKNLILVTDEDSDAPFYTANRFAGQSAGEPPNVLTAPWKLEVDAAAAAVIANNAFINMLINPDDTPARSQYGNPASSAQNPDFSNFNPAQTLLNLQNAGYGDSLEAQVLEANLVGRAFNIGSVNNANFIDNFFDAKVAEIIDNPIPEAGATLLMTAFSFLVLALRQARGGRRGSLERR